MTLDGDGAGSRVVGLDWIGVVLEDTGCLVVTVTVYITRLSI